MLGRSYLELVLTGLGLRRRVEEVDRENLDESALEYLFKFDDGCHGLTTATVKIGDEEFDSRVSGRQWANSRERDGI